MSTNKVNHLFSQMQSLFEAYESNIESVEKRIYRLSEEEQTELYCPLENVIDDIIANQFTQEQREAFKDLILTLALIHTIHT